MKTIIATAAAVLVAANVNAVEIYHGLENGNSDLSAQRVSAAEFVGTQPSIGDSVSRYQGWAEGNPDLFKSDRSGRNGATNDPDIYMDLGGNPDLQF